MLGLDYPRITFHGAYLNSEKHNKFFLFFCNMVKLPNIYNRKISNFCTKWKQKSIGTYLKLGVAVKFNSVSVLNKGQLPSKFSYSVSNLNNLFSKLLTLCKTICFSIHIFRLFKKVKITFMKLKMHICPNFGPLKFYQFGIFRFGVLYGFSLRTFLTKSDPSPLSSCMCEY